MINTLASQTDIVKTLLNQLKINSSDYYFSCDILNPEYIPHAFYLFNNGFGMLDNFSKVIFDNNSRSIIEYKADSSSDVVATGKKMMQWTYEDFVRKEFVK